MTTTSPAPPTAAPQRRAPRWGLWWLSPGGAVALVVPGTLILAWALPDAAYRVEWRTAKWLTEDTVLLLLTGVVLFIAGSLVPLLRPARTTAAPRWPGWTSRTYLGLWTASRVLFWATMFGYLAMAAAGFRNGVRPGDLIAAVVGQDTFSGELKDAFAPIAGITTFTQVGIAYVVVAGILLSKGRAPGVALRLGVVLALALARAYLLSERLAILELLVPLAAILLMHRVSDPRPWVRAVVRVFPVLMIPLVMALFAVFEYSRSWIFFQGQGNRGFLEFAVMRFAGYYVTAYNNGQMSLLFGQQPGRLPYETLEAIWTAPGASQLDLYDRLSRGGGPGQLWSVLEAHGNPEFNNSCGLCAPILDWGPAVGLLWLLIVGALLGLVYRSFRDGHLLAVLAYPPLVTGLFELPRYLYWTQGRLVPALIALLLCGLWVQRQLRQPAAPP